ncbi:MAG: DUF1289 domain-containing protein [Woeseiaceae bacterium]|nr:DUF1289 domain-containing protein [Woeseiaceae bacterium]
MILNEPDGAGITTVAQKSDDRTTWPLSPCVMICTLDDDDRCLGCGRTLEQISDWALMSKEQQWAVIDELADWTPDD